MTDAIRAALSEARFCNCEQCQERQYDALLAVLDLCDDWDRFPGDGNGLRMGQMTHGCASYWIRDAIAEALGVT
jgi:hypothetical protein